MGFDDWIEIFEGGLQTDSSGQSSYWLADRLDQIVQTYNPDRHEAPLVIGHPEHDSPAYGWVERLKREGLKLYAKFHHVADEFIDMVKKGLFTKRSVAFYSPDHPQNPTPGKWHLRHVGWLGAMPPAVKGLKNVRFGDVPATAFEFNCSLNNREDAMEKNQQLQAELDAMTAKYQTAQSRIQSLEEELKKLKEEKSAGETASPFAEMEKKLASATAEIARLQTQLYTQEETAFCEKLIQEGKLTPAEKDYEVAELVAKRLNMQEITFGESKTTNYALHREKLSKRPPVVQFGDSGAGKQDVPKEDKPAGTRQVIEAIRQRMKS